MKIVREASELGLKPGEWPKDYIFDGRTWVFKRTIEQDGEFMGRVYQPVTGPGFDDELHILND